MKICYTTIYKAPRGKRLGIVKYMEDGYYVTDYDHHDTVEQVKEHVDILNKKLGLPDDVVQAMEDGSMFGWHVPAAQKAHDYWKEQEAAVAKPVKEQLRAYVERLLSEAKELQTQLWDNLSEIESVTGVEIESEDLDATNVDDLLNGEEETEAE